MLSEEGITLDELALAARNHGMPLEALRYDLTPAGLHYLLIHYDIPVIDPDEYVLTVDGAVAAPVRLGLSDLAARPPRTETVTMECAGNGRARLVPRPVSQPWLHEAVGTAAWTGIGVGDLLAEVGPDPETVEVLFTGGDRGIEGGIEQSYQRSLSLDEARREDVILALRMNGSPILPQHGYPVRLVVPGWYGMTSVKWVTGITLLTEPFRGYQHDQAYRVRTSENEAGRPVDRIQPRSLIRPPGIPDFLTRRRVVDAGPIEISGRAWSGFGPIERVEVSHDGGETWSEAELGPASGRFGWRPWIRRWEAEPGVHLLASRATDDTGRSQPMEPEWNLGGYEVNAVQWVEVEVR